METSLTDKADANLIMTKAYITYAGRSEVGMEWMKTYISLLREFMAEQEKLLRGNAQ